MKTYIVVKYDLFPYYLTFHCEDTGEHYKVCDGLSWGYNKVICRLSKVEFDKLVERTDELKAKKLKFEEEIKQEAVNLINSFKS